MNIYDIELYMEDLRTGAEHTLDIDSLKGESVLITGAGGTIGSFIVDMLMEYNRGHGGSISVLACGRNPQKLKERFSKWSDSGNLLEFLRLDVLEKIPENFYEGHISYIIHAAGNAYPSAFIDKAQDTVKGNVFGTANLLKLAKEHDCRRFVYVSSGEVYSLEADTKDRIEKLFLNESDIDILYSKVSELVEELGPRSCYPVSKYAAELLCLRGDYGFDTQVVRPSHTFGPGITGNDDRAHVQFALKAARGETIVLNSAGTVVRSYNYVADAASAIISVMTKGKDKECADICSPDNVISIRGLAELIGEAAGVGVIIKEPDERQKSLLSPINRQVLDAGALLQLGWRSAFDLKKGTEHFEKIVEGIDK